MMYHFHHFTIQIGFIVIMAVLNIGLTTVSDAMAKMEENADTAYVQFVHASPDPEVAEADIYISDESGFFFDPSGSEPFISDFTYQDVTEFKEIPADHENIIITGAGSDEKVYWQELSFFTGNEYVVIPFGELSETDEFNDPHIGTIEAMAEGVEEDELHLDVFHSVVDAPEEMDIVIWNDARTSLTEYFDISYGSGSEVYFSFDEDSYTYYLYESGTVDEEEALQKYGFVVDAEEHGGQTAVAVATGYFAGSEDEGLPGPELMFAFSDGDRIIWDEPVTGVDEEITPDIPTEIALKQNYPNPFNPTTLITYDLPENAHVRLAVFDLLGREVAVLVDETMRAGTHNLKFDAAGLASGVYVYQLRVGNQTINKRMTYMK